MATFVKTIKNGIQELISGVLFEAGDYVFSCRSEKYRFIPLNDDGITLGNASSGADYAGEQYRELFNIIKLAAPNTGSEDFDGNDTVSLGLVIGHVLAARGIFESSLTVSGSGINSSTLGAEGGAETHGLSEAENGAHTHSQIVRASRSIYGSGGISAAYFANDSSTTGSSGSGDPHQNTQPTRIVNLFIKY